MITMKNWHVNVTTGEKRIGYTGENKVHRLRIHVDSQATSDWTYFLDIAYNTGQKNYLLLIYENGVLQCDILREYLQKGPVAAQVRAVREDQEKHSNIFGLIVEDSILAVKEFDYDEPSAFEQLEQRLTELYQDTEAAAERAEYAADRAEAAAGGGGGGEGGTTDHRFLTNRDAEDQHPIEAISGLEEIPNRRVLEIWNGAMQ